MAKIRLGVVNPETWDFLRELHEYFQSQYETTVFQPRRSPLPLFRSRVERRLLRHDLNQFLRRNDVVFFEWASELLALATSLPKSARIVTRLHRWELYAWADAVNWDAVDRIILVSEAKRREFVKRFPQQGAKIVVIPESIDFSRFPYQRRAFSGALGILCHLRPRKRVYDLIAAFADLLQEEPSLRLYVGGNPVPDQRDYHEALLGLVEQLSLQETVHFDGYIQQPWEWYPKIDIFISNSYSEGLQVSPMEAMASGCYTLSHWWAGAEELLPPEYLYLTNRQLQEKVLAFCRLDEAERESVRKRLHSMAAGKFDINRNKLIFSSIVEELAQV